MKDKDTGTRLERANKQKDSLRPIPLSESNQRCMVEWPERRKARQTLRKRKKRKKKKKRTNVRLRIRDQLSVFNDNITRQKCKERRNNGQLTMIHCRYWLCFFFLSRKGSDGLLTLINSGQVLSRRAGGTTTILCSIDILVIRNCRLE